MMAMKAAINSDEIKSLAARMPAKITISAAPVIQPLMIWRWERGESGCMGSSAGGGREVQGDDGTKAGLVVGQFNAAPVAHHYGAHQT